MSKIDDVIKALSDIAGRLCIAVEFNSPNFREDELNHGVACENSIWLSKFDDAEILALAFFHEVGHILFDRVFYKRKYFFSEITHEGAAWEVAFMLASEYMPELDAYNNTKLRNYAHKCLNSYRDGYSNEQKDFD